MPTKLETLIHAMLTENTGKALCDSGGDTGRHWQRNAGKTVQDFKAEPAVTYDALTERDTDSEDILFSVSTFRYLTSGVLELDDVCDAFNAECVPAEDWGSDKAYGLSNRGQEWLEAHGFTFGTSWNTYNGENTLSQILQGTNLKREGDYLLLQVHGGADVRGGYTDARLVKFSRFQEYINPCPYVSGTIDGIDVSSMQDGYRLTTENGERVKVFTASKIELFLDNE